MGKLVPDIILRLKTSGPIFQFYKFSHILLKLIKIFYIWICQEKLKLQNNL